MIDDTQRANLWIPVQGLRDDVNRLQAGVANLQEPNRLLVEIEKELGQHPGLRGSTRRLGL